MKEKKHTRVYRMASSQFVLTRGTIPSLWAIYSSGNTVVFVSISTMSIAVNSQTYNSNQGKRTTHQLWVSLLLQLSVWNSRDLGCFQLGRQIVSDGKPTHAKSTFSRTKSTRSGFNSRILTEGSVSSCISTEL